jgi:50S ribosome-binding GTPase
MKCWFDEVRARIASLSGLAIVFTILIPLILAILSISDDTKKYLLYVLLFLIAFTLWTFFRIIYLSYPRDFLDSAKSTGMRVPIENIGKFYEKPYYIGVVGKQNVGKTTFVEAVSNNPYSHKKTNKPYLMVVSVPQGNPQTVGLIDSAGESNSSQFLVSDHADELIFFLDHNSSLDGVAVDKKRSDAHIELINQLIIHRTGKACAKQKLTIVANKYDRWGSDPASSRSMRQLAERIASAVVASECFELAGSYLQYSNKITDNVIELLQRSNYK